MPRKQDITERFWKKVNKDGPVSDLMPTLCWLWTAYADAAGYGIFRVTWEKNPKKAHRVSWALNKGPIPEGMKVLHKCDVRACVRPDHLYLGTQTDNMRDRKERTGYASQKGENNTCAKLTQAQVDHIRKVFADPTLRSGSRFKRGMNVVGQLASEYGVTKVTIYDAASGKNW